jgi:hypothetical protein
MEARNEAASPAKALSCFSTDEARCLGEQATSLYYRLLHIGHLPIRHEGIIVTFDRRLDKSD